MRLRITARSDAALDEVWEAEVPDDLGTTDPTLAAETALATGDATCVRETAGDVHGREVVAVEVIG